MSDHRKPFKATVPPSLQSVHPVKDRNVSRASSHSQQSSHVSYHTAMPPIDCPKNVKEGVKSDVRTISTAWGRPPRDIASIADEVADEEEAVSRSETDDSRSTPDFGQPRHQSTDESSVDNDDLADHDERCKDAHRHQNRPATTAETDINHHVTQQGPDRKSIQQKQKEAATFQKIALTKLLQTSLPRWLFTPDPAVKSNPTNIKLPTILEKQVNHAKADAELAVYLSYKRTLHGKIRFLEEYKGIQDRSFGEGTSVDREMKAFAYAEENLNAEGEEHTKKGKEGSVKSEVHGRFVGRPLVVEKTEGEILALAGQVTELQAKLKHLRGLAQGDGDDTILAGNVDDADKADAAEAAESSGALKE